MSASFHLQKIEVGLKEQRRNNGQLEESSDYLILDLILKKSAEGKDRFLKLNSLVKS